MFEHLFLDSCRRYIKENERKELLDLAISFCAQTFKDLLKRHSVDKRDDNELLTLIVEIYKAHKKCLKNVGQKETPFSSTMVDTYRAYVQDKVRLPDTVNVFDLAVKLCLHELNAKKMLEKTGGKRLSLDESSMTLSLGSPAMKAHNVSLPGLSSAFIAAHSPVSSVTSTTPKPVVTTASTPAVASTTPSTISAPFMPGTSRRGRPPGSKNTTPTASPVMPASISAVPGPMNPASAMDPAILMSLYSNPAVMQMLSSFTDPIGLNTFLAEFYRAAKVTAQNPLTTPQASTTSTKSKPSAMSSMATIEPKLPPSKIPKIDRTSTPSPSFSMASINKLASNSALQIIPNNPSSISQSAIITPKNTTISAATSAAVAAFQSGSSTVISIGSGQLTITPSVSMTASAIQPTTSVAANKQSTLSVTAVKPKKGVDNKRKSAQNIDAQSQAKLYRDMKMDLPVDLPKSLSIIPASSTVTSKPTTTAKPSLAPPHISLQPEKVAKSKKKSHAPTFPTVTSQALPFGGLGLNQNIALMNQYEELMRAGNSKTFMNKFEQFLSIVPPLGQKTSIASTASSKTKASQSKATNSGSISVKQLETLQDTRQTKSQPKSMKPHYSMAQLIPKVSTATSSSVLNPYALANAYLPPAMLQTR